MDGFSFTTELPVRYRDLDTNDHVNNAVYGTYLEQARFEYFDEVLGVALEDGDLVVVRVEIDYLRPVELSDDVVEVGARVDEFGTSSFEMTFAVEADGERCATGSSVQVAIGDEGEPRPVPDAWRASIDSYEGSR